MADTPAINNKATTTVVLSDEDDMWTDELMEQYAQQMEEQLSSQSSSQPDTTAVGVKRTAGSPLPVPAAKKMRSDHIKTEPVQTAATSAAFVVPANTQKHYGSAQVPPLQQPMQTQQYTNYSKPPAPVATTPAPRASTARAVQSTVSATTYNKPVVVATTTTSISSSSSSRNTNGAIQPMTSVTTAYDADTNSVSDAEDNLLNRLTDGIPLEQLRKYPWPAQPAMNTVAQVANLIFGYDGWSWAISNADFIKEPVKLDDGHWIIYAECTVRVTVRCGEHARGKKSTGLYRYGYALDGGKSHVVMHAMQCAKTAAMNKAVRNALAQFGPGFGRTMALIEQHLAPRTASETSD